MRRALLLTLLLTAPAAPAGAAPPYEDPCATPPGARVVASSPQAVVTATPPPRGEEYLGAAYDGCLRVPGRWSRLTQDFRGEKSSGTAGGFVLAGDWVAFETDEYDADSAVSSQRGLSLADLRSGSVNSVASSAGDRPFPAVRLDADGALAWLADDTATGERRVGAIVGGAPAVLDRGPASAVAGLELVEGRARWANAGQPRERDVRPLCRPGRGEDVFRRSPEAVVFRVVSATGAELRGCVAADGRRLTLVPDDRRSRLAGLELAGLRTVQVDRLARADEVVLTDLSSGVRRRVATAREPRRRVITVALSSAGAVAWLERVRRGERRTFTLLARTSTGRRLVLDRDLPRPTRLSFTADLLRWTSRRGGRARLVG